MHRELRGVDRHPLFTRVRRDREHEDIGYGAAKHRLGGPIDHEPAVTPLSGHASTPGENRTDQRSVREAWQELHTRLGRIASEQRRARQDRRQEWPRSHVCTELFKCDGELSQARTLATVLFRDVQSGQPLFGERGPEFRQGCLRWRAEGLPDHIGPDMAFCPAAHRRRERLVLLG